MGSLSNTFIRSLLGFVLLCVFAIRPCAALVRNMSVLKNLSAMEKGVEEPSKENKETKESKGRYFPDYEMPVCHAERAPLLHPGSPRPRILSEVHGCPGPILRIPTPPPDAAASR